MDSVCTFGDFGCPDPSAISVDTSGPFIGAQIGLNRQISDRLVVGLESDVSFSDISGDNFFGGKAASSQLDMFGTIRARAGVLIRPNTLLYATGGLAWGDWNDRVTMLGETNSFSGVDWGWTVGGGVETYLSDTLSVKFEYLYLDFGDKSRQWTDGFGGQGTMDIDHQIHTLRLGVNYKLW